MLRDGALLEADNRPRDADEQDVEHDVADRLREELRVRLETVSRIRSDLPIQVDGPTLEERDEDDGDVRDGRGSPRHLHRPGRPFRAVDDSVVEEQEQADLQPEYGRHQRAGHENKDAAVLHVVRVAHLVVAGVFDGVGGVAESQIVYGDDCPRDDEHDGGGHEDEARVNTLPSPYAQAETGDQ